MDDLPGWRGGGGGRGVEYRAPITQPIVCFNRFKVFEEEDGTVLSFLVGDSMIRQQLNGFWVQGERRKRLLEKAESGYWWLLRYDKMPVEATYETLFVVRAFTFDVIHEVRSCWMSMESLFINTKLRLTTLFFQACSQLFRQTTCFIMMSSAATTAYVVCMEFVDICNDFFKPNKPVP